MVESVVSRVGSGDSCFDWALTDRHPLLSVRIVGKAQKPASSSVAALSRSSRAPLSSHGLREMTTLWVGAITTDVGDPSGGMTPALLASASEAMLKTGDLEDIASPRRIFLA